MRFRALKLRRLQTTMEIRHLKAFVAVAFHLHFSQAARELHIAQPALSQQIAALENILDARLFERSTRHVVLTPAGERLLPIAKNILHSVDVASLAVKSTESVVGKLSMGFAGASAHIIIPELTRFMRANYAGVQLNLLGHLYSGEVANRIASRQIDLGLVRLPVESDKISTHIVQIESLMVAIPSDHRLAIEPAIDLNDLVADPFVTFPATGGSSVREAMFRAASIVGFVPHIVQEAPDSLTILDLVAAGIGVTLTVSSVSHIRAPGVIFKPLRDPIEPLQSAIGWRDDNPSDALAATIRAVKHIWASPHSSG